jgi:hypothetical protein
VLHNFYEKPAAYPNSGLIIGPDGGFYGTAGIQGATECPPKMCGVVFEIKQTSTGWQYHVVHKFHGPRHDDELPAGLIFDKAGNPYGTTFSFGHSTCITQHSDCGTVFELSPTSKGGWEQTILYTFIGGADGAFPVGNLVLDSVGNLYSVTQAGGSFNGNLCSTFGCGLAYELSPGASGWTETVLYTFTGGSDGAYPISQLQLDSKGNVFGIALAGGVSGCYGGGGCGTVFALSPNGSGWKFTAVYSFSGTDGEPPRGIVFDPNGNLVGAADGGLFTNWLRRTLQASSRFQQLDRNRAL